MSLSIIFEPPPNYADILKVFPKASMPGVYFCYGRAIFIANPTGQPVHGSLMAHESVHAERQIAVTPEAWWLRYLDDAEYRLNEEIVAHQAEYRYFEEMAGVQRNERSRMLRIIAHKLAAPLYGNMVTPHRAKQLITGRENPDT